MLTFASMAYTLFKSKFVSISVGFSAVHWSPGQQESAVQKTADVFQYLYCCLLLFYSIVSCDIKHTSKTLIFRCSPEAISRDIHKFLIVKVDLKFRQKSIKINGKDFICRSVARECRLFGIPFHAQATFSRFVEHGLVKSCYTLLSWQGNVDYLELFLTFK